MRQNNKLCPLLTVEVSVILSFSSHFTILGHLQIDVTLHICQLIIIYFSY